MLGAELVGVTVEGETDTDEVVGAVAAKVGVTDTGAVVVEAGVTLEVGAEEVGATETVETVGALTLVLLTAVGAEVVGAIDAAEGATETEEVGAVVTGALVTGAVELTGTLAVEVGATELGAINVVEGAVKVLTGTVDVVVVGATLISEGAGAEVLEKL